MTQWHSPLVDLSTLSGFSKTFAPLWTAENEQTVRLFNSTGLLRILGLSTRTHSRSTMEKVGYQSVKSFYKGLLACTLPPEVNVTGNVQANSTSIALSIAG